MTDPQSDDERTLASMGYEQELHRGLGAFSNFAISLSIICILAGGVTSFHVGLCSVGGAAIGVGWPLGCLFSLVVALTMAQIASAYPTAGGLYHWGSILGGRFWGWVTAWFNLAGLITVLAAINVGTYETAVAALVKPAGLDPDSLGSWKVALQACIVLAITAGQAFVNHRGIRLTSRLTDFSGYWILFVATTLTVALFVCTPSPDFSRLWTFDNFSGLPEGNDAVWPSQTSLPWLLLLGLLLPAYTVTGFDASAHASEETINASSRVPWGIVQSVVVSGVFGWVLLCAVILAAPSLREAAGQGKDAFVNILRTTLPAWLAWPLIVGIVVAQLLCGLATVTSASRMLFAFARDGGVPFSATLRRVNPTFRVPVAAIWTVSLVAVAFSVWTPVYATITAVCAVLLYVSYVIPITLGVFTLGRTWTRLGPWSLGLWYRPLAVIAILGCGLLFVIAVQPPNEQALVSFAVFVAALAAFWIAVERKRFRGPPTVRG
jgi:amino acid transporter